MKKIVMIGPVYPYKGGIAHYTSLLYKALAKKYDVRMISYSMQYPKLLFKKEQKDYNNDMFKIENTEYLINTANPFNIYSVGRQIKKMNPDLVIIQWWHPYFAPCYRILESALGKKLPKLFICHNVFPHERFVMDKTLSKMVLKRGNLFVVHSKSDRRDLLTIKKDALCAYNPHPTYNAFKIKDITEEQAKKELQLPQDRKVLLFFGFVRGYKGLKHLLRAMPAVIKQLENVTLMVVGAFENDKQDYLDIIHENNIADNILIQDGYTPDGEVEKYFAACDAVVCPYESATQSGIIQIAYGFEKPVIATEVGGLPDVVKNNETGYIVEPCNPEKLAESIIELYRDDNLKRLKEGVIKDSYRFSWDRMVEKIEGLYEQA